MSSSFMCELFCLSARKPMRASFSLRKFAGHGAPATGNVDGWGVAFHEGNEVRLYKEPEPAGHSQWLDFIERHTLPTRQLVSHIRRATQGGNSLSNTQPFVSELGGRTHLFAHNGDLKEVVARAAYPAHRFHPVGQTDSESAFCLLLERLAPLWRDDVPPLGARLETIAAFAAAMRPLGTFNFLYSDGEFVFGHAHRRRQADGTMGPGLWFRHRHRAEHGTHAAHEAEAGVALHPADGAQELSLLASVPVTAGPWRPLAEGEIVVLAGGELQNP
ncbi:class II glutamine amidotransferase [Reyranella sp.]|uniref:class II glutamine amidotransferase n=1 Tax=Reyranella sp. TaxID=1929291 RepID=UPI00403703EA